MHITNAQKVFFAIFSLTFFFLLATASYALPFTIVPKAGTQLPTTVPTGATVPAYYTEFDFENLVGKNSPGL
jgi:hypothetical protein